MLIRVSKIIDLEGDNIERTNLADYTLSELVGKRDVMEEIYGKGMFKHVVSNIIL